MANLSKDSKEKLSILDGCEVRSVWNYACTVSINRNEVWYDGEKIDTLNTNDKVQDLWDEYYREEFGGCDFYY